MSADSINSTAPQVPGTLGQRLRDGARDLGARMHAGRRGEPAHDEGVKLADIPFGGRRVLRLRIVQSERHPAPALSIRMWERDEGGTAWPLAGVGAGFIVARANLPAFAEAVARALELMWNDEAPPTTTKGTERCSIRTRR